jgi:hypothetical protein
MDAKTSEWNVCAFGAVGNGTRNDTEAFQTALDAAQEAGGGIVRVPAGTYCIQGNLRVGKGVTLLGAGGAVNGWGEPSILHAHDESAPFISLIDGGGVHNVDVYYPEQIMKPGQVIPFPYAIKADGENCHIIGVSLRNPYNGICLDSAARHLVRDVHGSPLNIGLYVNQCYDVGRIENVHFWPFMGPEEHKDFYLDYLPHHATAFVFGRTDWEYVFNTFCWGYKVGYHFSETEHGSTNGNFLGIGADATEICVLVDQAQQFTGGILITNGEFVPLMSEDCAALVVRETFQGYISLMNCGVWGPHDRSARIAGNGRVNIASCNFIDWDKNLTDAPIIDCCGGVLTLNGNHFTRSQNKNRTTPQVALRKGTRGAIVSGNFSDNPWRVINEIGDAAQMGLNLGI